MKNCLLLIQSYVGFPCVPEATSPPATLPHITQLFQQLDTKGEHMGFIKMYHVLVKL